MPDVFNKYNLERFQKNRIWVERYLPVLFIFVFIALLGIFSLNISQEVNKFTVNLDKFYNHPYKVKGAVSNFNLDILEVVSIWSGNGLDEYSSDEFETIINKKFVSIDSSLAVIKENYLGESQHLSELAESYQAFKNYITTPEVLIDGVNQFDSNPVKVRQLVIETTNKLKPIETFATSKAESYLTKNHVNELFLQRKLNQFYTLTVVLFVIGLISIIYLLVNKNSLLLSEKEKFIKAIKYTPVPMIVYKDGIIKQISEEWIKQTGYTKEDIPTIKEWCRKAYGEAFESSFEYICKTSTLDSPRDDGIWKIKTKSGEEKIWKFHSGPLGDGYTFSTAVNLTEEQNKQHQIEELFEEKVKLATAVEQSPVSIVITDTKGKIEYVNDYFTQITGYTIDEVIGKNPNILRSGFQNNDYYKNLWETILNGEVWRGDLQNIAKDGSIFWEVASISPIIDTNGEVINFVAVKENITEKKHAQDALIKSEKKYRDLFTRSTDACLIIKDGVFVDCNEAALKSLGMQSKNELIGLNPSDVAPEYQADGSRSVNDAIKKIAKAKEENHVRFEWLHKKVNGEVTPSEVMLTKLQDDEGDYFYVVWRDITERKKYEKELKESEQKLKAITDNIEGALHRYVQYEDGTSTVKYISKGAKKLYGLTPEQIMEDETLLWNQIVEEDYDRVFKSLQKSAKEFSLWNCRYRIKTPDNKIKWIRGTSSPSKDGQNNSIIWDTFVIDVTKYVELQDKINQQLEEKSVLLAEIHHRVKNNLAVISGMLELQAFSSENEKAMNDLLKSVNRIKSFAIIHELIYETGDFTSVEVKQSIKSQVEYLSIMYKNHQKIDFSFELDNVTLNVNQAIPFALLVNELLMNAFMHAFKGIDNPRINLSVQLKNNICYLTYLDNGVGFKPKNFDKNKQTLGQNLIDAFVNQLGGTLILESKPNEGAKIILKFKPTETKGTSLHTDVSHL